MIVPLLLLTAPVRLGVAIGNNGGVLDDAPLRYAARDAARIHEVFSSVGGIDDASLLIEASALEVEKELLAIADRVAVARGEGAPVELLVHYSGHADEHFLHLSGTRMTLDRFLELVRACGADVTVVVLDACRNRMGPASKGATVRPPLEVKMRREGARGNIVIRSVRQGEVAIESDSMRGSVFTHHWIAGLQGAADGNGDRRVTLSEAYALARRRTMISTMQALGTPQTPTYDLELQGEEDLVLAELDQADAQLVFPEDLSGSFYVAEKDASLFSELEKERGSILTLALPRGEYFVYTPDEEQVKIAEVSLVWRREIVLSDDDFARRPRQQVITKEGRMVLLRDTAITAAAEVESGWLDGMPLTVFGRAGVSHRTGLFEWHASVVGGRWGFEARESSVDTFAFGLGVGTSLVFDQSFGSWITTLELRPLWMRQQVVDGDRFDLFVGQVRLGEQLRIPLFAGVRASVGAGVSLSTFKSPDRFEVRPSVFGLAGLDYAF